MKVLVIPDPHGSEEWKNWITKENEYDKCICLGDWFDAPKNDAKKQIANYKAYMHYVHKDWNKYYSLLGERDFNYLVDKPYQVDHAIEIKKAIEDEIPWTNIAVKLEDTVFSHAGISSLWLEYTFKLSDYIDIRDMRYGNHLAIDILNALLKQHEYYLFDYDTDVVKYSGGDENAYQGPLWIKPSSLVRCMEFDKQIVGHTETIAINGLLDYINDEPQKQKYFHNVCPSTINQSLILADSPDHLPHIIEI